MVARNLVLAGNWKGDMLPAIERPVGVVLHHFAIAWYHLIFGMSLARAGALAQAACLASAAAAGFLLLVRNSGKIRHLSTDSSTVMLALMVGTYCVALMYVDLHLPLVVQPRYLLPVLPILILPLRDYPAACGPFPSQPPGRGCQFLRWYSFSVMGTATSTYCVGKANNLPMSHWPCILTSRRSRGFGWVIGSIATFRKTSPLLRPKARQRLTCCTAPLLR